MAGSTISSTVTSTVTLGSASYPSPLTVTATGDVASTYPAATGVFGPAGGGTLINDGTVIGAVSLEYGTAGTGVYLLSGSTAINNGIVAGGTGDNVEEFGFVGGTGGIGADLHSGSTAINNGTIIGGTGGIADYAGNGGFGVYLAAGAALTNQAMIAGGAGGLGGGGFHNFTGYGADGVVLQGGSLANSGTIVGGYGANSRNGGRSGRGVDLLAGTVTNTGTIIGGKQALFTTNMGANGVYLAASATLLNSGGTIIGGAGAFGGAGVVVAAGGTVNIAGVVIGGLSGSGGYGAGVELVGGGSVNNIGTVIGGSGYGGAGIYLANGGTLTNAATIVGGAASTVAYHTGIGRGGSGVVAHGGGVVNTAFISGGTLGGDGVDLVKGGKLTNDAGATIIAGRAGSANSSIGRYTGGAGVNLSAGAVTNAGTIAGGDGSYGVPVGSAGRSDRRGGGGVVMGATQSATAVNSGLITGGFGDNVAPGGTHAVDASYTVAGGDGADVGSGDTLTNTGTIIGGAGVFIGAGGLFGNFGTISGGTGASVASGGTFFNTGTVIGGVGVYLAAGATFTTAGTTAGGIDAGVTVDAVQFAAAGTLVLYAGASFIGQVAGHAGSADVLYLSNGNYNGVTGTLTGLGTQFTDFSQITIGARTSWSLTGANTIASGATLTELSGASLTDTSTLLNNGAVVLDPSTLTVAGLIGTGSVTIGAGSTLAVQTTIAAGQAVVFSGSDGYLHLGSPADVGGIVANVEVGDTIDLQSVPMSSVSYSAATGLLTFSGGSFALALANDGGSLFIASSSDGTEVFSALLCFCANTQILTPQGERAVQDLAVGDLVTTHRGEARPIVWIGEGRARVTRGQRGAATPVIVRKGALAENVPHRNLRVTKGHSLWFGGVLIPMEYLVNHRLIAWDDMAQEVSLYHVELASHDVLVANGAPAESYRDDGNRWLFQNANSGWELEPQAPCAPVLTGGAVVDAVWRRLLGRAGPRPGFVLTDDPDLHLVVDGRRVEACERRGAAYVFALAGRPGSVRIVSRAGAPAELGVARDPRVLGVAVQSVALRWGTRFRVVEAAELTDGGGFYPFEQGNGVRWTDGDAVLPAGLFAGFEGAVEVVVHVGGATRYPLLRRDWGGRVAA